MTRNRTTLGGSGRLCLAVLMALAMLVSGILPQGLGPSRAYAAPPSMAELESALKAEGFTIYSSEYQDDIEGLGGASYQSWYLEVNLGDKGGVVLVEKTGSAGTAANAAKGAAMMASAPKPADVNGVSGYWYTGEGRVGDWVNYQTNVWWARDDYFCSVYLMPTQDVDLVRNLAETVDSVFSGTSGGTGTGDGGEVIEDPPDEPTLSASASPSYFTELFDEAVITVSLGGPDTAGKQVSISGHDQDASATTDSNGRATFTVRHSYAEITEYRFTIDAEGMRREITIPVTRISILPEPNPVTQLPYSGVIADGRSTLEIEIDVGEAPGTLSVVQPDVGTLEGDALGSDGTITLGSGQASLRYVPPAYLPQGLSTQPAARTSESDAAVSNGRSAGAQYSGSGAPDVAMVSLVFGHKDESGATREIPVEIAVARTPVMLVHGFTGDRTTWAALQRHLAGRGFDAIIDEYYRGDQDIHDQSRALGQNIERELYRCEAFGLKGSRVDVVGHSMGGLIARNYAYGLEPHPSDVRKIIMVGTPNHGASFFDKVLGNLAAEWFSQHKQASQQLYTGSAFLKQLNSGESVGRHLHPDIQYGNIYGELTDYVVPNTSAFLNGVMSRRLRGVTHSTAIPLPGVPITDSPTVLGWVEDWLGEDIPRARLRSTKVQVVSGQGEVYLSGIDVATGQETREDLNSYPKDVAAWEEIGTGQDGRARIRLSVAGLAWGTIDLAPDSHIAVGNVTPGAVTVRVRRGQARFRSLKREGGGHFQVTIGEQPPGEWYTFAPDAKVIGLDTDFVVSLGSDGAAETLVLEGEAQVVRDDSSWDSAPVLGENQAAVIGAAAGAKSSLVTDQWWTDGFYRPGLLEVLQEWYAVARAQIGAWLDGAEGTVLEVAE